jgi:elongation factor P--(R)-beta-lysine ligase
VTVLPWPVRVAAWDAAIGSVRACLRARGLCEVTTPVRVDAAAPEPWIEPVAAPPGFLATSPELAMKRMLCRGSGSIFEVAHVLRAGERGAAHREEFHLVEWYRVDADVDAVIADVEAIVAAVVDAVAPWRESEVAAPRSWTRIAFFDLVEQTTGLALVGDEDDAALEWACSSSRIGALPEPASRDPQARTLERWTAFFTAVSDAALDPWLAAAAQAGQGVHVVDFPAVLAALSERERDANGRAIAARFESHAFARELCNGYRELRDATEQRMRFATVLGLRAAHGLPPLPMPESFLADLATLGLPKCSGAALGLDRLLAAALGAASLDDVTPHLD